MSTTANNSAGTGSRARQIFNRTTSTLVHSDSIDPPNRMPTVSDDNDTQTFTWVDFLMQLDRAFSGGLLRLFYNIFDLILLIIGIYYGTKSCDISHPFVIISIFILIVGFLSVFSTFLFLPRNWKLRNATLADAARSTTYRQASLLRHFLHFLKFIAICVGTGYIITKQKETNTDCEFVRFCLGIVCFNTWILIFNWPPKPSLPVRRSLAWELIILFISAILNCIYFAIVAVVMVRVNNDKCIYHRIEDLLFGAPLKSFAYVGLILALCKVGYNVLAAIINQTFYRILSLRRLFIFLSAVQYAIAYALTIFIVYYYSVGAVLLFRPRSSGSCSTEAPGLYNTLFIWQLILIFAPLVVWCLVFLLCCVGVIFGACLAACLPASITVPLVAALSVRPV